VALVCLLAAAIMAGVGQFVAAEIALGGAAIAALVALFHRNTVVIGTRLGSGKMLGRGPYTSVACGPSHELVQKLKATLDELRDAAREGEWNINWEPLDESCRQATASDSGRNYADAVRHYCRAISHMMNELRSQNEKKRGNTTTVDFNVPSREGHI
jgi:hypothetical protein